MPKRVLGQSTPNAGPRRPETPPTPASPSSEPEMVLQCPICSEPMLTLAQLNRHLDDEHTQGSDEEAPVISPGIDRDFKNWFKESIIDNFVAPSSANGKKRDESSFNFDTDTNEAGRPHKTVKRTHWQKSSGHDVCHDPHCNSRLGLKNGMVNCRCCGKLFCDKHTMYRMKLNEDAEPDTHDEWSRCCRQCFVSRPSWIDVNDGLYVDLTRQFSRLRSDKQAKQSLRSLNLERRLFKLVAYLERVDQGQATIAGYRQYEQELVPWSNESVCKQCGDGFSWFERKHHCRVCGGTVCGNIEKGCSMPVPAEMVVNILNTGEDSPEFAPLNQTGTVPIRICVECKHKLFDKHLAVRELEQSQKDDIMFIYNQFTNLRRRVELGDLDTSKLIDYFARIEHLGKQVSIRANSMKTALDRGDPDVSIDRYKLYRSLEQRIVGFLQDHLPALRRKQQEKLAEEKKRAQKPPPPKMTKREIRERREKLIVLEEQRFMIQQTHDECKRQRKFDDLQVLDDNIADLTKEIEALRLELGDEAM